MKISTKTKAWIIMAYAGVSFFAGVIGLLMFSTGIRTIKEYGLKDPQSWLGYFGVYETGSGLLFILLSLLMMAFYFFARRIASDLTSLDRAIDANSSVVESATTEA